jgi:hypothetical protein
MQPSPFLHLVRHGSPSGRAALPRAPGGVKPSSQLRKEIIGVCVPVSSSHCPPFSAFLVSSSHFEGSSQDGGNPRSVHCNWTQLKFSWRIGDIRVMSPLLNEPRVEWGSTPVSSCRALSVGTMLGQVQAVGTEEMGRNRGCPDTRKINKVGV